jgi:flagellar protein FlaG
MDTATLRQSFIPVPVAPLRADAAAPRDMVATELPATQSVVAASQAPAVQNDASGAAAAFGRLAQAFQRPTEQRIERDRKTELLVFKKVNTANGEVVLQLPDQSLLNLRAYLKEQADAALPHEVEKTA